MPTSSDEFADAAGNDGVVREFVVDQRRKRSSDERTLSTALLELQPTLPPTGEEDETLLSVRDALQEMGLQSPQEVGECQVCVHEIDLDWSETP